MAVCEGSNAIHPLDSPVAIGVSGNLFVGTSTLTTNKWKIDDVPRVRSVHGLRGVRGRIAAGIIGLEATKGFGGLTFAV